MAGVTIAPKRFQPYRLLISHDEGDLTPALPYQADFDIATPNNQITRILVSLHGTGGDAMAYYSNGRQVVETRATTHPQVLAETLVVAPQFVVTGTDDPSNDEFTGTLDREVLYWQGGRSGGNLSGNHVDNPRSFRIRSFDVMDQLLEHLSRPELFPNLRIIVLIGHSNGGRVINRYAAASPLEERVLKPRGVHIRYITSGSGAYLYLDGRRWKLTGDKYKDVLTDPTWVDEIEELEDMNICAGYEDYNLWPNGLQGLWNYPGQVGAERIKAQYGGRDVVYMVGETDLTGEEAPCPEIIQGNNTLARTLLYYHHLRQVYGSGPRHRIVVVPGVGHWGLGTMNSPEGRQEIFAPIPVYAELSAGTLFEAFLMDAEQAARGLRQRLYGRRPSHR